MIVVYSSSTYRDRMSFHCRFQRVSNGSIFDIPLFNTYPPVHVVPDLVHTSVEHPDIRSAIAPILRSISVYTHLESESGGEDDTQHLPVPSEESAARLLVSSTDPIAREVVDLLIERTSCGGLLRD